MMHEKRQSDSLKTMDTLYTDGLYYQQTVGKTLNVALHHHTFYEIVCVLDGACYHRINDEVYRFAAGNAAFLRPGDKHRLYLQEEHTNVLAISVMPSVMELFLTAYDLDASTMLIRISPDEFQRLCRICGQMSPMMYEEMMRPVRLLLGELLIQFARVRLEEENPIPPALRKLFSDVQERDILREGVHAFQRLSNFSYSQLSRLTVRYLGMTPGEYITALRLRTAYEMLVCSNDTCESISEAVGFASFSHFSKLIRERYGMSPARLRRCASEQNRTV